MTHFIALSDISAAIDQATLPAMSSKYHRRAAVAIILRSRLKDTEMLFIKRATKEADPWSGHMAFPGGHVEPDDLTLQATAIRETFEEIGLDLNSRGQLLGPITPSQPSRNGKNMLVAPYVFTIKGDFQPDLNDEVDEVVWCSLNLMLKGELYTSHSIQDTEGVSNYPGFDLNNGRVVWGMTYGMVMNLFNLLEIGWQPPSVDS